MSARPAGVVAISTKKHDDERVPRRFGDYALLERLGQGGMGEVFLARASGLAGFERLCVLKTIRADLESDDKEAAEAGARFVDEAKVAVRLQHRNLCQVFDAGQVGPRRYLAMEHVHGRNLLEVQKRAADAQVAMPEEVALSILAELLEGLDAAHRLSDPATGAPLGLVHRDVSPHNVLLSFEGEVKVIDFGLAASSLKNARTEPGVVMGKLAYFAPEQAQGHDVDVRADVFACAVVAVELLTGKRFYEGLKRDALYPLAMNGGHRPEAFYSLAFDVQAMLDDALHVDVNKRTPSCAAFRTALRAVQRSRGMPVGPPEVRAWLDPLFAVARDAERKRFAALLQTRVDEPVAIEQSIRFARAPDPSQPSQTQTEPEPEKQKKQKPLAAAAGAAAAAVLLLVIGVIVVVTQQQPDPLPAPPPPVVVVKPPPPPPPPAPPPPVIVEPVIAEPVMPVEPIVDEKPPVAAPSKPKKPPEPKKKEAVAVPPPSATLVQRLGALRGVCAETPCAQPVLARAPGYASMSTEQAKSFVADVDACLLRCSRR